MMKSKKQIFIEQIEILEKQLKMKNGLNEVSFRNDVSLLFLMLHEITKDIHNTKTPLAELVELNKKVIHSDPVSMPLPELLVLLKKYFSNINEIKARMKLGCLCINVFYLDAIKMQMKQIKKDLKSHDESKVKAELTNFSEALQSCFSMDLQLSEIKNTNSYSDDEQKLLNEIRIFTSPTEKTREQCEKIIASKLFNALISL